MMLHKLRRMPEAIVIFSMIVIPPLKSIERHSEMAKNNNCRIMQLEEGPFKPLEDELQAEQAINWLLIAGILVPITNSLIQTALAYLYFQHGHPWSRVLKETYAEKLSEESQGGWKANPLFRSETQSGTTATVRAQRQRRMAKGSRVIKSELYS